MSQRDGCNRRDHNISRRQVLGSLAGATGLGGLGTLLDPGVAEEIKRKNRQVLFIWLDGGISQLESWDPKPESEFGGPFRSIPTILPGTHFSELTPHTAQIADRLAVIRNMSTKDENHSSAVPRVQRGDPKNRGVTYPFLGSAVSHLLPPPENQLPAYMHVKPGRGGYMWKDAGFLGARYGALGLGDGKPPIHIRRPPQLDAAQAANRDQLRRLANARFRKGRLDQFIKAYDYSYDMAAQLGRRQDLFDSDALPAADKERYGTHPLGRHLLQARRLLEAGVQFVKVTSYYWDTHADHFNMHRSLVPQIDRPFAALIRDLEDRGLLDQVVVIGDGQPRLGCVFLLREPEANSQELQEYLTDVLREVQQDQPVDERIGPWVVHTTTLKDSGFLGPSGKLRRPMVEERYRILYEPDAESRRARGEKVPS